MQTALIREDTFPHLADTLVRGTTASLPGGPHVTGVIVILAIVLVNVLLIFGAVRGFRAAGGIKKYLGDFPTHNASTALALVLIFETALIVLIRLALGLIFPAGYDTWLWTLVGLAGVNVAGLIGKRITDIGYVEAKSATTTTAEKPLPQAGVVPSNPNVRAPLESLAQTRELRPEEMEGY